MAKPDAINRVTALYEHFLPIVGNNALAAANLAHATLLAGQAPPESPSMTVEELAERLKISKQLAYKLCRRKSVKATNITPGAKRPTYRIAVEAFNEFLSKEQDSPKPPLSPKEAGRFRHLKIRA